MAFYWDKNDGFNPSTTYTVICTVYPSARHSGSGATLIYSSPGAGGRAIKFAQPSVDTLPAEEQRKGKVSIEPERRPTGRAGVTGYILL